MYPEASINFVSPNFDKRFCANTWSHEQSCAIRPLVHHLIKRPPIKKGAIPRNAKGLIKKSSDEKRGNPKKSNGSHQKDLQRKERQPQKTLWGPSKDVQ
jgi:hypothetical protein